LVWKNGFRYCINIYPCLSALQYDLILQKTTLEESHGLLQIGVEIPEERVLFDSNVIALQHLKIREHPTFSIEEAKSIYKETAHEDTI